MLYSLVFPIYFGFPELLFDLNNLWMEICWIELESPRPSGDDACWLSTIAQPLLHIELWCPRAGNASDIMTRKYFSIMPIENVLTAIPMEIVTFNKLFFSSFVEVQDISHKNRKDSTTNIDTFIVLVGIHLVNSAEHMWWLIFTYKLCFFAFCHFPCVVWCGEK